MMRKSQLRQEADKYLRFNRQGAYRIRLYRHYVIHKMINDLFIIGEVPPKWYALTQPQLSKLVSYWQQKNISTVTIMKYMTIVRKFLKDLDHHLTGIDNPSLDLSRKTPLRKNKSISPDVLNQITNPIAHVLLGFQIHFGLTLSETMRLQLTYHIKHDNLWISRCIASNSHDRVIPVCSDQQKILLEKFMSLTGDEVMITAIGYDPVRYAYRKEMKSLKLTPRQSYRYLYAQMRYEQLAPTMSKSELILLIMREMGLKSRVTLWGYLRK